MEDKGFDLRETKKYKVKLYILNKNALLPLPLFPSGLPKQALCRSKRPSEAEAQRGWDTGIRLLIYKKT